MPATYLLYLDERTDTATGEDYVLDRAERDGGTVHALGVVDTSRYGEPALSSGEVLVDDAEDRTRRRLASFAERARERGVDVETRCRHGTAGAELVDRARAIDADVVVCAKRLPHATRTRLESIADSVISPAARVVA